MQSIAAVAGSTARLFPLTSTQQGLLFHRFLDEHAGIDVQQLVLRWHEPIDVRAFERAWQRLGVQHDVLRTSIRWEGLPEPKQEVHDAIRIPVARQDLRERSASEQERAIDDYLDSDRRRGFDLARPPLMRVRLFELSDSESVVVWSFHHVLLDTQSVRLLLEDLATAYDALRDNRDVLLRARPPFRTFTEWLHARDLKAAEGFWRERLRGFSAPTQLVSFPLERERGSTATHAEMSVDLAAETVDALRRTGIDLRSVLTAAWGVLLARTSGENDVVFGVAEPRRDDAVEGAGAMLGFFINTIPARFHVADNETVSSLLQRVSREGEEARAHQHAPLASIQRWSSVPAGTGLFDSIVVFESEAAGSALSGRADVELRERTSYPIALTAWLDSLTLRLAWDPRRFDDATIARMAGHLRTILSAIPNSLETPAARLPILTADERRQVLYEWNDTRADYPRDKFVHQLFEQRAAAHPERVALRFNDESLSYAELNRRANRLAHRLRSLGVGPDVFVGIYLERSVDMIVALLGILKAGGAYVPLDPSYPKDRLELMLEDSRAAVLLTQPSLANQLETHGAKPLILEQGWHTAWSESEANPQAAGTTEALAYVIYTSGSTGKPKGVQLPHRAVVNFLETMRREPGLTEDDVVIGLTTLSFDIAGLEIYLPLTTGAQLDLIGRDVAADARLLAEKIGGSGATVVQATPATWRMLLDAGWSGNDSLKLLCGGEALARDLAEQLLQRCGSLWNMYGPTETTIWSTVRRVTPVRSATVPIGRPIANTQVYVLDPALEPVPIGVPGELHIGGDGVARGYLNREELTAERFIRNPFVSDANARMYKTGDAVRWLPNGELEYLNRLDNQVKLRGYRIELGEIEAALRKHEGVADAVVTVRTDAPGGKALAAYWIAEGEPEPAVSDLKGFLKESLPEYMVPSFFVRLTELPLTPNGKVDRKALPAPERTAADTSTASVPPRDEIEQRLARIWCDVLKLPSVGVHDNFFELGGESLLAVQMFVRVEAEFGRQLPLATLLQAGTIESLAAIVREEGWAAPWTPLIPFQTNGTKTPFFCVHGVGGNVLNYRALSQRLGDDQPFYGLQARGMDGKLQPIATIEEMAGVYLSEIRKVQPRGPYLLGGASFGGVVAYEMAQQLRASGDEAAFVALFDTNAVSSADEGKATQQSLATRIKLHLGILLRGPDRIGYIRKKARRLRRKTVYRTWQTVFAAYQKLNRPLPKSLQDVAQNNYRALRIYKAKSYDGRVGLFCARLEPTEFTQAKKRAWRMLVPSLEIYDVPGDHLTMVDEPHVAELAGTLAQAFQSQSSQR